MLINVLTSLERMRGNLILLIFSLTISNIIGQTPINGKYSKDGVTYYISSTSYDGRSLSDKDVDGVVILKVGKDYYVRNLSNGVNFDWYMAATNKKDDISFDMEKASLTAAKLGTYVFIPQNTYYIGRKTRIYSDLKSDRGTIKMPSKYERFFILQNDKINIQGINFENDNKTRLANAPITIEINGMSDIVINNCRFTNGRIASSNFSNNISRNLKIENNVFESDFSNYKNGTHQNDIISIYNINGLTVTDNRFKIKNANRVIKISSYLSDGSVVSSNVKILRNSFYSSTNSRKQLIDLFQHTKDVEIGYNSFKSFGHESVIEDKTINSRSYKSVLKIHNNTFDTDGTSIRVFGDYSIYNGGSNSGIKDVVINNNTVNSRGQAVSLNIANCNSVNISDNSFSNSNNSPAHARFGGIGVLSILSNSFISGYLIFTKETSIGKSKFRSDFGNIVIERNEFRNTKQQNLMIFSNSSGIKNLRIRENKNYINSVEVDLHRIDIRSTQIRDLYSDYKDIPRTIKSNENRSFTIKKSK